MILSFDPVSVLAWAALAAYVASALALPPAAGVAQAAALLLHGATLVAHFGLEARAGAGIRFGFAPVLSLTAWLVPAFAAGVLVGERLYGLLSPSWFQRIVSALLFCAGLVALAG